jgi:hypothetical protein
MALLRPKPVVICHLTTDNIYVVNDGLYIPPLHKCHKEMYKPKAEHFPLA